MNTIRIRAKDQLPVVLLTLLSIVQALALLSQHNDGWAPSAKEWDTIRRALEALGD